MRIPAVFLLLAVVALAGCNVRPEISKAVLTDQLDQNQKPARQLESYPKGTQTFYLAVQVLNPNTLTRVKVRWQYEGKLIDEYTVAMPDSKDRWITFDLRARETFPPGAYKAEVFMGSTLDREIPFRVD